MVHHPRAVSRHRSDLELRGARGGILAGKYNDGTPATRETFARRILAGMEASIAATRWAPADSIQWQRTEMKLPLYEGPARTVAENRSRMADPKTDAGIRLELGAMLVAFAERIDRPLPQVRALGGSKPPVFWGTRHCSVS